MRSENFFSLFLTEEQSVSKWESDSAYPEMDKIIQICDLFHVGMDDLVRKDVSLLYVGNKTEYENHMNVFAKMISLGLWSESPRTSQSCK